MLTRISRSLVDLGLNLLWRLNPDHYRFVAASGNHSVPTADSPPAAPKALKELIQRFPYWRKGRRLLAEHALGVDDIGLAYAEAQALRLLSQKGSSGEAHALSLLGRCHLRRNDPTTALTYLEEAQRSLPHDSHITEERAAALTLLGDRARALSLLQGVPKERLSTEGAAALKWLASKAEGER